MKKYGLQKTTLLDYPGHVAATIFLSGCNFCCPFCHNSGLITEEAEDGVTEEELLQFLKKRKGILEGVCITGGEPTLFSGLEELIQKIRNLGYLVKLDTNGYRPEVLKALCAKGLLDYVAMDIKAGRSNYKKASQVTDLHMEKIVESAAFLLTGAVSYEFRTTVVKGIHGPEDFEDIGKWLAGCARYFIQSFVDSDQVLCQGLLPFSKKELETFAEILRPSVPVVKLRGVD